MRRIRYQEIAQVVRGRIESGDYAPGQVLPSEAALGAEHDASRVTIRKALEELRKEDLVDSRQGFGWYVKPKTLHQPLLGLQTIEKQLEESGRASERRILDFRFIDAPSELAEVLGPHVLEVRRLNLADGEPFARVTVWCREDVGRSLSKSAVEGQSFYQLLEHRLSGATQTIGAGAASARDAELLNVPVDSPVLVVRRVTRTVEQEPVLVAEHVFPGHLTEFEVMLPMVEDDRASSPPGLRLVNE